MASLSPTQRTLRQLRQGGCIAGIVEKINPYVGPHGIKQDLFGFIDIIAIDPERGIVAVQSCGSSYSAHVRKIEEDCCELVEAWIHHAPLELWGWRKVKLKPGSKAMRWRPRVADVVMLGGLVKVVERGK